MTIWRRVRLSLACAAILICGCGKGNDHKTPSQPTPSYLVGAIYLPQRAHTFQSQSLRAKLVPPQSPLLGAYDTANLEVVEAQIGWAANHGVDFFVLPFRADEDGEPDLRLQLFPHAPNIDDIQFCLSYLPAPDATARARDARAMAALFSQPRYLKIDGRPVVWLSDLDGQASEAAIRELRRELAPPEGGEVFLVGCLSLFDPPLSQARLYDAVTLGLPAADRLTPLTGSDFSTRIEQSMLQTKKRLEAAGAPVLPMLWPGLNERGASGLPTPIIARSWSKGEAPTSGFDRLLTSFAIPNANPEQPLVLIDSWNDWSRDTGIEPLKLAPPTSRDESGKDLYTGGYPYSGTGLAYLELLRNRTVALFGEVVDEQTGYPVEGVAVTAWDLKGRAAAVDLTDSQGRYRLSRLTLKPGEYLLGADSEHAVETIVSSDVATRLSLKSSPQRNDPETLGKGSFEPYFPSLQKGLQESLSRPPSTPALSLGTKTLHVGPSAGPLFDALRAGKDWESPIREILKSRLASGDTVVDVGAGVGVHALEAAEIVGPQGRVICLESDRANLRDLVANAQLAGHSNLEAHNYSVGERVGWETAQGVTVEKRPLDSLPLSGVALIRLGARETHENLLKGARKLLQESQPILILDVPGRPRRKVLADLSEIGYRGVAIEGTDSILAVPLGDATDRVLLDVGDSRTRSLIREGFSVDELEGGTTFAWSDQVESSLLVPLRLVRPEPYVLGIRAKALGAIAPVRVRVLLNGADMGYLEVTADWMAAEFAVPEGLLQEGYGTLLLRHGKTARPRAVSPDAQDDRAMSVAVDKVWLCPAKLAPPQKTNHTE